MLVIIVFILFNKEFSRIVEVLLLRPSIMINVRNVDNKIPIDLV